MGDDPSPALPTGTVTFLLTDIEGSTRLWESMPDEMQVAVPCHYEVLDDAIARHGGARPLEQGEGDSIVAAFPRASDALAAAFDAQRELRAATPLLRVRMALHTGEAQLRDARNYFGEAIIRCARLRACAHGGQVLLSDAVASLVGDHVPPEVALVDMGSHRLRDLARAERVWQLTHPDLPAATGLRSIDERRDNLRAASTPLVGRDAEVEQLRELVGERRLVTITGAGGVGKTRLATEAAGELVGRFDDGVWMVELASVTEPGRVATTIATAAGATDVGTLTGDELLVTHLRDAEVLLVVDNCEHVVDTVAPLVQRLLDECPRVSVLATSREPLGVDGETTWRAPSLRTPDESAATVEIAQCAAVKLFVDRAVRARPDFDLTEEHATVVAHLCRRLDGIPLAIELAAARVRVMPLATLASDLDQRFRLLTGGARTVVARQRTLLASVEWSYDLLDETEQTTLRRLAAFVGGFTLEAAEAVGADDGVALDEVFEVVSRLVDKSLVSVDASGRYGMLETIRLFALDRAHALGELASNRDRHLRWWLELCRRREFRSRNPTVDAMEEMEPEYANLLAALEWSLDAEPAVELLAPLGQLWEWGSRFADASTWTHRVLAALDHGSADWVIAVTLASSAFAGAGGPALELYEEITEALGRARDADDGWAVRRLLVGKATIDGIVGDEQRSQRQFDEAAELARASGDEAALVTVLGIGAVLSVLSSRNRRATALVEELDRHGTSGGIRGYLVAQARVPLLSQLGRYTEAIAAAEVGIVGAPPAPRTGLLCMLAWQGAQLGRRDLVDGAIARLPAEHERGLWQSMATSLDALVALLDGDDARARAVSRATFEMALSEGNASMSGSLVTAGVWAGDDELGEAFLATGDAGAQGLGWQVNAALIAALIGLRRGEVVALERSIVDVLAPARDESMVFALLQSFEILAAVGPARRTALLGGAAARLRDQTGTRFRIPGVAPRVDQAVADARTELGDDFDRLWAEGEAMGWDRATDVAIASIE